MRGLEGTSAAKVRRFLETSKFLGRNFKKPLAISVPKWYVVSNKSETWIHLHFGAANSAPHTLLFFTLLFSSFTFLSFTLPAPQGARKAMTQPARVTAFSFCLCYRRPNHLNALRFTLGMFRGRTILYWRLSSGPAERPCTLAASRNFPRSAQYAFPVLFWCQKRTPLGSFHFHGRIYLLFFLFHCSRRTHARRER